jgi:hypothetical protein
MLKLPVILIGLSMVILAFIGSSWMLGGIGAAVLIAGLFILGLDFGQDNKMTEARRAGYRALEHDHLGEDFESNLGTDAQQDARADAATPRHSA